MSQICSEHRYWLSERARGYLPPLRQWSARDLRQLRQRHPGWSRVNLTRIMGPLGAENLEKMRKMPLQLALTGSCRHGRRGRAGADCEKAGAGGAGKEQRAHQSDGSHLLDQSACAESEPRREADGRRGHLKRKAAASHFAHQPFSSLPHPLAGSGWPACGAHTTSLYPNSPPDTSRCCPR